MGGQTTINGFDLCVFQELLYKTRVFKRPRGEPRFETNLGRCNDPLVYLIQLQNVDNFSVYV